MKRREFITLLGGAAARPRATLARLRTTCCASANNAAACGPRASMKLEDYERASDPWSWTGPWGVAEHRGHSSIPRRNRPIGSVPRGRIARCNKSCNPPYHLGLSQQGRMTLIRHDDDFKLVASCQHLIQGGPGQHI
jgi:hypothetical protein